MHCAICTLRSLTTCRLMHVHTFRQFGFKSLTAGYHFLLAFLNITYCNFKYFTLSVMFLEYIKLDLFKSILSFKTKNYLIDNEAIF